MKQTDEKTFWLRFKPSKKHLCFNGESAFNSMQAAYNCAIDKRGDLLSKAAYSFAGQTVQINSVGSNIANHIIQAYAHLRNTGAGEHPVKLSIDLWETYETSVPCPVDTVDPLLRSATEYGFVIGAPGDRFLGCQSTNMTSWFDRSAARIICCITKSESLSPHEQGKPLHFPLLVWHTDQDAPVMHAGLVSYEGQGVLLAGRGGAGKSTIALSCLAGGFHYLGDDYIALEGCDDGSFEGHSLYNTAWLEPGNVSRFPFITPHAIQRGGKKSLIFLSRVVPEKLARACPIRLLLLPRINEQSRSRILPATKAEALLALTPTSIIKLPVSGRPAFEKICQLVHSVACYWIEPGGNLETIPHRVKQLLNELVE